MFECALPSDEEDEPGAAALTPDVTGCANLKPRANRACSATRPERSVVRGGSHSVDQRAIAWAAVLLSRERSLPWHN